MDYVGKIKALLNLAEDPRTPEHERELARTRAYQLMAKMQIDEADIAAHGEAPREEIQVREVWLSTPRSYSYEYATMAGVIAEIMGARGLVQKVYHTDASRTKRCGPHWIGLLIGFASDLDRAMLLFNSLGAQCEQAVAIAGRNNFSWSWMTASDRYNFKRSFIVGFKQRVTARLRALFQEAAAEVTGTSTELVLVNRKKIVSDFVDATMNLSDTRARTYGHAGASAGSAAGARASLGQTTLGAHGREIGTN